MHLARLDFERDVAGRDQPAEAFGQPLRREQRLSHGAADARGGMPSSPPFENSDEDQRPQHRLPMLGQARQHAFENEIGRRAEHRTNREAMPPRITIIAVARARQCMIGGGTNNGFANSAVATPHTAPAMTNAVSMAEGRKAEARSCAARSADASLTMPKREWTMRCPRNRNSSKDAKRSNTGRPGDRDRGVAEIAVPGDVQAVVAAVLIEADPEEIDHLAERQGDHDEIDAGRA
jgi:hypothetical protein